MEGSSNTGRTDLLPGWCDSRAPGELCDDSRAVSCEEEREPPPTVPDSKPGWWCWLAWSGCERSELDNGADMGPTDRRAADPDDKAELESMAPADADAAAMAAGAVVARERLPAPAPAPGPAAWPRA